MRWYADTGGDVIRDESGALVAQFFTRPSPEELALMCAAPELLRAVKVARGYVTSTIHWETDLAMIDAAIAKAEGRS